MENDHLENSTIDRPADDVDLQHRQLTRQNSISSKFRQNSIKKR
jgi:hypothetical protein